MSNSDESEEENIIRYGTPLEPYEEDEIPSKRKYQQTPDQYAVDSHGRRRFHGAFTGGFSAGFGNSVGTPEGWTPATFKSSRLEKSQVSTQRPEDFMDEEDRSEFGIAPRSVQTHGEFSGQKRPKQKQYHDGPIPGEPVLQQVVRAVHETAAVKMLRSMGWKPGQGTGDRMTREDRKRAKDKHKVYGCYIPEDLRLTTASPSILESHEYVVQGLTQDSTEYIDKGIILDKAQSDEDSLDSEFEYETLFAPEDYEPYVLQRKNDRFGLGYSGLSRHSVLGNLGRVEPSHLLTYEKGKKVSIRGQAFGVGAMENEDEDIYATEDMSHYDFAIGKATEEKSKKVNKDSGANILEGFVKAKKPMPSVLQYPPPALPRDYVPGQAGLKRSRFEASSSEQRDQGLGRHELTAEARGALLGETPLPKPTQEPTLPQSSSSNSSEDPIAKILGRNVNFVSTSTTETPNEKENSAEDFISIKDSGKELKKVFRPFMSDPKKQARYEKYLRDKSSILERDSDKDKISEWERNRELVEFEQAAKLYKPLTGIMGDRFTHASEPDDGALNPLCAVAKSSADYGLVTPEQVEAAKQGVYGVMTRKVIKWMPDSLVCKRFNVPVPGGDRPEQKKEDKPKISYSIFSYLESSVHDKESFTKEQSKFSGSKSLEIDSTKQPDRVGLNSNKSNDNADKRLNVNTIAPEPSTSEAGFTKRLTTAEMFLKESEKDMQDKSKEVTETINKFDKMDLYKSIFLSDTEDEEEAENVKQDTSNDTNEVDFMDKPKNVERNLSPPRGIFANIDFDEINSWRRKAEIKDTQNHKEKTENQGIKDNEKTEKTDYQVIVETETYGPKIPENLIPKLSHPTPDTTKDNSFKPTFRKKEERKEIHEISSSSSSDEWVDLKESKTKKHKKKKSKKHKSKEKHKKSKHKKKDR